MINRRLILLFAAAGGLAAYGLWGDQQGLFARYWKGGTEITGNPAATGSKAPKVIAAAEPLKSLNPLYELSIEALSDISERPLFNPTRAPAPQTEEVAIQPAQVPDTEPAKPAFNPDDFTLLAVSSSEKGRIALIRRNSSNEMFHIKEGDSLADVQVVAVTDRQVTVGIEGGTFDLKMFGPRSDAPGQAAQGDPDAVQLNDENNGAMSAAEQRARATQQMLQNNETAPQPPADASQDTTSADGSSPADETDQGIAADQSNGTDDDGSDQ